MKIEQLMTRPPQSCEPNDCLEAAARIMWENDCGCVPVCIPDGDGRPHPIAMITDRDIAMATYTQGRAPREITVRTAMSQDLATATPADTVADAIRIMRTKRVHRLPIVDAEGCLVGILSLSDVAQVTAGSAKAAGVSTATVGQAAQVISAPRNARSLMTAA